jgi:hypothetical protein
MKAREVDSGTHFFKTLPCLCHRCCPWGARSAHKGWRDVREGGVDARPQVPWEQDEGEGGASMQSLLFIVPSGYDPSCCIDPCQRHPNHQHPPAPSKASTSGARASSSTVVRNARSSWEAWGDSSKPRPPAPPPTTVPPAGPGVDGPLGPAALRAWISVTAFVRRAESLITAV